MHMRRFHISISLAALLSLSACSSGGGGDSSSPSDALFEQFFSIYGGGSRSIGGEGMNTADRAYQDCGYTGSVSRAAAAQEVRTLGGSVSVEIEDKWCALAQGTTLCLVRLGEGAFALDEDTATQGREIEVVAGLDGGRHVVFESVIAPGLTTPIGIVSNTVSAVVRDINIPASGNCSNGSLPARAATDINGSWSGKRVVYDLNNKSGYQQAHSMLCTAQACNIQTRLFIDLTFPEFSSPGVWRANSQTIQGGAVMSRDGQALALWFCPVAGSAQGPTQFGTDCELYAFNRAAP